MLPVERVYWYDSKVGSCVVGLPGPVELAEWWRQHDMGDVWPPTTPPIHPLDTYYQWLSLVLDTTYSRYTRRPVLVGRKQMFSLVALSCCVCTLTTQVPFSMTYYCAVVSNADCNPTDRKSVGSGKSVSVRVDLGGRRNIKKKK